MTKQHTKSENGAHGDARAQAAAEMNEQHQADESVIAEASVSVGEGADQQGIASTASPAGAAADAAAAPQEAAPEQVIAQLLSDLETEKARYADLTDKYQRSAAEFQNSRRRVSAVDLWRSTSSPS